MGGQNQDKQEFHFIKEKIKDKPVNKRRLFLRMGYHVFCGALFGAAACLIFVLLQPHLETWLHPKDSTISIPKDEPEEDNENKQDTQGQSQEPQNQTVYVQEELGVEGFQELQKELYAIGKQANKSVVTVTGVTSGTDWFNTPYESKNQASGIIIGNNGQEMLILTEHKVISGVQSINITFINEQSVSATLRKYDGNTGIAIISVPLSAISSETMEEITVATLGNSLVLSQGTMVIAIGSPLGSNYSILCGTITTTQNKVSTVDNNYTIFTTDMVGSQNGSGVLVNLNGEVVGLLMQDYSNENDRNTITAFSISELKQIIEDLSNNQDVPYLGLSISTVTDDIVSQYGLPKGVYIKDVRLDSPAMAAAIQTADVLVKINGKEITSVEQYSQTLLGLTPGDTVTLTVKRQGAGGYVDLDCAVTVGVLQ